MLFLFRKQITNRFKCNGINLYFKRNHKKDHWSILEKKIAPHDKALKHFDDFYKELFREKWPSVRLGLLERNKQVVVVNNFGDVEETEEMLKSLGAMNLRQYFELHEEKYMEKLRLEAETEEEEDLEEIEEAEKPEKPSLVDDAIQKQIGSKTDLDFIFAESKKKEMMKQMLLENDEEASSEIDEVEFESIDSEFVEYDESRIIDPEAGTNSAILNEFVPATSLRGLEDYVPEGKYFQYYQVESGFKARIEKEYLLEFPEHLKVYTFERGDISRWPEPALCSTKMLNYYILDGASVLVALALNVQKSDYVLDMCASPGGKCVTVLQTLLPDLVVCNELVTKRYGRLNRTLRSYFYDFDTKWKDKIKVTHGDALHIQEDQFYNKILVDVPCTNDRVSLYKDENNYFTDNRIKERLQLPEKQSAMLAHALKILHPGGTVVYSTCTLSPVQNDGVVHMALQQVWNETGMEFIVMDMTSALQCTRELFNYGDYLNLKYGHVVVPFLPSNFGPMYFCKIKKPSL